MSQYQYDLCDCSCADPCVFGKCGSSYRCNIYEIMDKLSCTLEELPVKLTKFREEEKIRINERFKKMYPNGINIQIVEAERDE